MKRMIRTLAMAGLVTAIAGLGSAVTASPQMDKKADENSKQKVKVGEKVPDFTLTDLDGKEYTLSDFKGKTIVLEWTNPSCPYIVGVYKHGIVENTLKKMKELFGDDAVYLVVNSTANKPKEEVIKENRKFLKQHDIAVPVLIDYDGEVGKMFGAKHTPDMYVIDTDMTLRYFGGFTDDHRFQNTDECMNYVVNALEQLDARETVSPDTARRWGCSVKYARK